VKEEKKSNDANSIQILPGLYVTCLIQHVFNQNHNYIVYTIFKLFIWFLNWSHVRSLSENTQLKLFRAVSGQNCSLLLLSTSFLISSIFSAVGGLYINAVFIIQNGSW